MSGTNLNYLTFIDKTIEFKDFRILSNILLKEKEFYQLRKPNN